MHPATRRLLSLLVTTASLALAPGLASAQTCLPGTVGPGGGAPCTPCQTGFFMPFFGNIACLPCPYGRFADAEGSIACADCAPGTYANFVGAAACLTCPDGFIAPNAGSAACEPCLPGYTSDPSHTTCVPEPTPTRRGTWGSIKFLYR